MFGITLGGLFVVSALIGVIATGLDAKIEDLRKGRSFVIESEHTLILGWSESVFTILSELRIANESEKDPVVVILADKDRVEMEDLVRQKVGDMKNTRVVCRTGNAIDIDDLRVANPEEARSIIVLSPEEEDPDSQVIKTVLALVRGPVRREDSPARIVAEIQDPKNMEAARLVGGDDAVIVDKSETISRLIVQTARQSGLSIAYIELLDFDGDEIYFRADERLHGMTFGEAQHAYEDCVVMGIQDADGAVKLNPPDGTVIEPGASVIAIAEDDSQLIDAPDRVAERHDRRGRDRQRPGPPSRSEAGARARLEPARALGHLRVRQVPRARFHDDRRLHLRRGAERGRGRGARALEPRGQVPAR